MLVLPLNNQPARQHKENGMSSTFVSVANETSIEIQGFYATKQAELVNAELPAHYGKRLQAKVPAFHLGRLATALHYRGKGIEEFTLFDAIERVTRIAGEVGGIGLVVNAKPAAVDFYQKYGFEQIADHPKNLLLPM